MHGGENEWNDKYDNCAPHRFRLAIAGIDASTIALSLSTAESNTGLNLFRDREAVT